MRGPATSSCFSPIAVIDQSNSTSCDHYSLSFFVSEQAALKRWDILSQREDAALRYGTHLGEVDLVVADGLMSQPHQKSGHFELHEYEGASLASRVNRLIQLPLPTVPVPLRDDKSNDVA
jgi:hypothetical protein